MNFGKATQILDRLEKIDSTIEKDLINSVGFYPSRLWIELRRLHSIKSLANAVRTDDPLPPLPRITSTARPNVHLVLLEGFVDFSMFNSEKYKNIVAHEDFRRFQKSYTITDVSIFGGRTAQSEFEVLCGQKGYQEFGGVEFLMMEGKKTNCLPSRLGDLGYNTIVSAPWPPTLFNIKRAYSSVGFNDINLQCSGCDSSYLNALCDQGADLYDGDLFSENLKFIQPKIKQGPIFNFVVTGYGHFPYADHLEKRPNVYTDLDDFYEQRAVNQFYYRTKAIAQYVRELQAMDPNGLVVFFGDHLPGLSGGQIFRENHYLGGNLFQSLALFVKDRKAYKFKQIPLPMISDAIVAFLEDRVKCSVTGECEFVGERKSRSDYRMLLLRAKKDEDPRKIQ